jgi:hypothetical protein
MTLEEFLSHLEKTPRDWCYSNIIGSDTLRRYPEPDRSCCPITAVAEMLSGKEYNVSDFPQAAKYLGLHKIYIEDILAAADLETKQSSTMRILLIRACGLSL